MAFLQQNTFDGGIHTFFVLTVVFNLCVECYNKNGVFKVIQRPHIAVK